MSAWSEWRAGLITDSEYRSTVREEELRNMDYYEPDEDYEEWDDEDDE